MRRALLPGDGPGPASSAGLGPGLRRGAAAPKRASLHIPFAGLAELEIADRAAPRVVRIIHQGAVHPDPLGPGVDAERMAVPEHHVGHLAGLQAARAVADSE